MKKYVLILSLIILAGLGFVVMNLVPASQPKTETPTVSEPSGEVSIAPSNLPSECKDPSDWAEDTPIIFFLSPESGRVETDLEISGCNFNGFEGDLNAWIENEKGVRGILRGQAGSTPRLIKVRLAPRLCQKDNSYSGLPCEDWLDLKPGAYKIYVEMMKRSNEKRFVITE